MRRIALSLLSAAALIGVSPALPAHADDPSTLTVVGTSDVFDSFLVQTVIKPGFEAAYPQYRLNYVSKGTGAAIAYAEAGTASALLVHAASLENQLVGSGYSTEAYGRALFYGDYVLLGPASDPAGVITAAPHDIVGAFERVAAAGMAGTANFVSRGGTPGTTVQEHAIWALTQGQTLCAVSAANGGGQSPSATAGDCPSSTTYPSWYHATGLTQAPNITNADTCNYSGGGCYVFTDRGTYDYLVATHAISNLHEVTRDNATTAGGGSTLLVNSFHAYAINPARFSSDVAAQINAPAAAAFLNWVTSPAAQTAVAGYLTSAGAPFLPDAAPAITVTSTLPTRVVAGSKVTISGTLTNVVPGAPPLAGQTVLLRAVRSVDKGAEPSVVATATTDAAGAWQLICTPTASATYTVTTGQITQIENAALTPTFGDLLAPGRVTLGTLALTGKVGITSTHSKDGIVGVAVAITPSPQGSAASLKLYKAKPGHGFVLVATKDVAKGRRAATFTVKATAGLKRSFRVVYRSSGQFLTATSLTRAVLVH